MVSLTSCQHNLLQTQAKLAFICHIQISVILPTLPKSQLLPNSGSSWLRSCPQEAQPSKEALVLLRQRPCVGLFSAFKKKKKCLKKSSFLFTFSFLTFLVMPLKLFCLHRTHNTAPQLCAAHSEQCPRVMVNVSQACRNSCTCAVPTPKQNR